MPSSSITAEFNELFTEVFEDLGEDITLHGTTDETLRAIVAEPQELSDGDGQAEYRTTFRIRSADKSKLTDVAEATIYGERWHILEPFPPRNELIAVPVRRHLAENTRSQEFDLSDEQATL